MPRYLATKATTTFAAVVFALFCAEAGSAELVAAYSFDSVSNSTVADASGKGNTLSVSNGAQTASGRYGLGMSFDGSDDVLVASQYNPALNLANGFTLSAWINPRSNSSWQMIVNKPAWSYHATPYFDWSMHRESGTGRIVLFLGCENAQRASYSSTPLNTWTHVAVTYDGSSIRHYLNGRLDRTTSVSCRVANSSSRPIRVGANANSQESMNGSIDDVRVYDRVLSEAEIDSDSKTPLDNAAPANDTTPPTVSIASPQYDSIVSGTTTVSATAADNSGVTSVQFELDGMNLGAADTNAPYSYAWDTTTVGDGNHTLSAIARDAAGNATRSSLIAVSVRNQVSAPTVTLTANPSNVPSGGSTTLNWTSANASSCSASGAWSGVRSTSGSTSSGALTAPSNTFTLTCTGNGGSDSRSVTVTTSPPAPTVTLSANPASVASGSYSTLSWSSTNATSCVASGAWSGNTQTSGSRSVGPLTAPNYTYTLTCTGSGGSASASANVSVTGGGGQFGLDFQGANVGGSSVRFRFRNPLAIYPATYIWRVYPRQKAGYYTTFFWGNDDGAGNLNTFHWGPRGADSFYGAHPYPNWPDNQTHRWEIATDWAMDIVSNELVQYNRWYTQALVAWADAQGRKHTVFYWDLSDTSKFVTHVTGADFGNMMPPQPALTWGDAPWNPGNELMNGVIRGIQIYSTALSLSDIQSEVAAPQSTSAGAGNMWYMNLNPTPSDISDKSGAGHHPSWVTSSRPLLWSSQ